MIVKDIVNEIEHLAPLGWQENYDNAGLQIGSLQAKVSGILTTLDITEAVIDEAIELGANLIVSHHPLIFGGLKRITGSNYVERCVVKAIQNNIAIYSSHTNLDAVPNGVNDKICEILNLQNCTTLQGIQGQLLKLVVFVPMSHADIVRNALFAAGAGQLGNYDRCSYNIEGHGTFRGNQKSHPFVGEQGHLHIEPEVRIEVLVPKPILSKVIAAMIQAHPYEEVAYDCIALENRFNQIGIGRCGNLPQALDELEFLQLVKQKFRCKSLKHTSLLNKKIQKIAVCGGSGATLIKQAIAAQADVFITADVKYHDFFSAENKILIADIGHFESEQYTKNIFYDLLIKKFSTFAIHVSKINTNPVDYL